MMKLAKSIRFKFQLLQPRRCRSKFAAWFQNWFLSPFIHRREHRKVAIPMATPADTRVGAMSASRLPSHQVTQTVDALVVQVDATTVDKVQSER